MTLDVAGIFNKVLNDKHAAPRDNALLNDVVARTMELLEHSKSYLCVGKIVYNQQDKVITFAGGGGDATRTLMKAGFNLWKADALDVEISNHHFPQGHKLGTFEIRAESAEADMEHYFTCLSQHMIRYFKALEPSATGSPASDIN